MNARDRIFKTLADAEKIFNDILSNKKETTTPRHRDEASSVFNVITHEMIELEDKKRRTHLVWHPTDIQDLEDEAAAMLKQAKVNQMQINKIFVSCSKEIAQADPIKIAAQALIKQKEQKLAQLLSEEKHAAALNAIQRPRLNRSQSE